MPSGAQGFFDVSIFVVDYDDADGGGGSKQDKITVMITEIAMLDYRWKKKKEEEDHVHRTGSKLPSKVDLLNW